MRARYDERRAGHSGRARPEHAARHTPAAAVAGAGAGAAGAEAAADGGPAACSVDDRSGASSTGGELALALPARAFALETVVAATGSEHLGADAARGESGEEEEEEDWRSGR